MTINRRGTAKHPKPKTKELKMSNIGELTKNTNGFYIGKIDTLAVAMTLALREVHSTNENAPVYEIHARSAAGSWVKVGALWEQTSNGTGEAFRARLTTRLWSSLSISLVSGAKMNAMQSHGADRAALATMCQHPLIRAKATAKTANRTLTAAPQSRERPKEKPNPKRLTLAKLPAMQLASLK